MWGRHLPADSHGRIRRDQALGPALSFALDPGDAVVFSANHLHGSELNCTRETRCVISMRMTLDRPQFPAEHVYAYVYSDWVATRFDRWSRLRVQLSRGYIEDRTARFVKYWRRPARRLTVGPNAGFPVNSDASCDAPPVIETAWAEDGTARLIRAELLPLSEIRPVDADWCALRTAAGYRLFGRACPHEGADLALGSVTQDGRITCPWHNLSFDCSTGQSPCRSIAPLGIAPGTVQGATVRFAVTR
jgi:nitrite reductase/ring-hydroxylating ferredoxin subunit